MNYVHNAQILAREAMESIEEKRKTKVGKVGVAERANRAIALRNIEKNAYALIELCENEKEKTCTEDSISKYIMLKKMSTLIDIMKEDIDRIVK